VKLESLESNVSDLFTQRAFRTVENYLNTQSFLQGEWRHQEVIITAAVTNLKIEHKLAFTPKDFILTWKSGAGTLTVNYDNFTGTVIDFTTTAAMTIRFFVGKHEE